MTVKELIDRNIAINREMQNASDEQYATLQKEYDSNKREIDTMNAMAIAKANAPKMQKSDNQMFREAIKAVREHRHSGDFLITREANANIVSSAAITGSNGNNMEAAGLPVTVNELINPLEMGLIYGQLGIKVATGVRGQIQWPILNNNLTATVAGETDALSLSKLSLNKVVAKPVRVGMSIAVDNEAVNDESFDLIGTVTNQLSTGLGRLLNNHILALAASSTGADLDGPMVGATTVEFAGDVPTYAELLNMKAQVLKTGAEMAGFCYVMDAEMYSTLEATSKDTGSGLFVIENGKINGAPVFITNLAAYSGKVAAGCFGYVALNNHGEVHMITDPYTMADRNSIKFTVNADFSVTTLQSSPFVVGAKGE